jgi:hydrogenase maturation protein HypF
VSGRGAPLAAAARGRTRVRVRVEGTVQGVGFRPFVHRLASQLALDGWVRNDERGVELEVEGPGEAVARFLAALSAEPPPLARVENVSAQPRPLEGGPGFRIVASARRGSAAAPVAPDSATCADCLSELFDPGDRRYRYPFINCTNCGPRFTIVRGVPYDRALTTMSGFEMCAACADEYRDPDDRRFHAEANACQRCGPVARLRRREGAGAERGAAAAGGAEDAVAAAAELLAHGSIVAVKGIGGYHLACSARDESVVRRLRERKHREDRPFALMVGSVEVARELAHVGEEEARLLRGPARPIVLCVRRRDAAVAATVAPAARELGLMLPYTPLHHLLLSDFAALGGGALVMTSGNVSDEPIAYRDEEAEERLGAIADAFLAHDRPIHMRTDDSVVRVVCAGARRRTLPLRRSRGYVPGSLELPLAAPAPLLACGAELKSTFCLARGRRAWVGHHIGDLRNWETLSSFREGVAHFESVFELEPQLIAHDLHPDYLSSGYAHERDERDERTRLVRVQHHHAHLAAVLAEHGSAGPAIGAIYDGAGLGSDGTIWGGELLLGGVSGFERAGSLRAVPLPGGDRAVREPWRMACAWALEAGAADAERVPAALRDRVAGERWRALARLARSGLEAAPPTSSAGRLFDAVAALCGVRAQVSYEGQAAIELEALADTSERGRYELPFLDGELDPRPAVAAVIADIDAGVGQAVVAARFHNALAHATVRACSSLAREHGISLLVLAGGVFQNRLLLERVVGGAERAGLRVLTPELLPPGDGAISYGQAAIAAAAASAGG